MRLTPAMRGFSQPETTKPTYEVGLDAAPMWVQYRDATTDGDNCTHVLCGVNSSIYARPLDTGNCRVSGGVPPVAGPKPKSCIGRKGRDVGQKCLLHDHGAFYLPGGRGFRGHKHRAVKMRKILRTLLQQAGVRGVDQKDELQLVTDLCKKLNIEPELEIFPKVAHKVLQDILAAEEIQRNAVMDSLHTHLIPFHIDRNHRLQQKKTHTKIDVASESVLANSKGAVFYRSAEWIRLRYRVLHARGNVCEACGASPKTGAVIHVDHVQPRYLFPERALDETNLQILCAACNIGKSHVFQTDWRK